MLNKGGWAWRPLKWVAQARGAAPSRIFPGRRGGGGCPRLLGNFIAWIQPSLCPVSWLWGWKHFLIKGWESQENEGSQILEPFSLASLFLPGHGWIPLYSALAFEPSVASFLPRTPHSSMSSLHSSRSEIAALIWISPQFQEWEGFSASLCLSMQCPQCIYSLLL